MTERLNDPDQNFEPAHDCMYGGSYCILVGGCMVASIIANQAVDRENSLQKSAFAKAIDPQATPCSHEQAVEARKAFAE